MGFPKHASLGDLSFKRGDLRAEPGDLETDEGLNPDVGIRCPAHAVGWQVTLGDCLARCSIEDGGWIRRFPGAREFLLDSVLQTIRFRSLPKRGVAFVGSLELPEW